MEFAIKEQIKKKKLKKIVTHIFAFLIFNLFFVFFALSTVYSARFSLAPSSSSFQRACEREIVIEVDATGELSNAAEIEITYDPGQITILDSNSDISGVQIEPGNAYEAYIYNQVSGGKIKLTGASFVSNLSSKRTFGTIRFTSSELSTSTNLTITYNGVGDTLDSNIADSATNNDLLNGVTNGTYTFINGPCQSDTTPPTATFISPINGATAVPLDSNITINISDSESGVDLSTLQFIVNGVLYQADDPEVSVTGNANNYTFTINPNENFPADQASTVVVTGSDISGNQFSRQILFNIPEVVAPPSDTVEPSVNFINPINLETGVTDNENIVIHILDDMSGVDINSLIIFINGNQYDANSPGIIISGNPLFYTIQFPQGLINQDEVNIIRVIGRDLSGNSFDRQIIFNIPAASECPVIPTDPGDGDPDPTDPDPNDNETPGSDDACFGEDVEIREVPTIIENFLNSSNPLTNTIFEDTIIGDLASQAGVSGFAAILSIALISLNIIPLLSLLFGAPELGFRLLGILFGRQNKRPWGLITDATTGKPISFAICQIFNQGSQYKISQTVSDLEGRYGFILSPGKYRLEVQYSGYKPYSVDVEILDDRGGFAKDVSLISVNQSLDYKENVSKKIGKTVHNIYVYFSQGIFAFGFFASFVSIFISFSLLNLIILAIYTIIAGARIVPKLIYRPGYSAIVNSANNLKVPYAQIKIFNPETWHLVDSKVSNNNGQFDFFGEAGRYALLVTASGFNFPSKKNEYEKVKEKLEGLIYVDLLKGGNNLVLYLDPKGEISAKNKGNIISPFG